MELTFDEMFTAGARGRASGVKIDDNAIRAAASNPSSRICPILSLTV